MVRWINLIKNGITSGKIIYTKPSYGAKTAMSLFQQARVNAQLAQKFGLKYAIKTLNAVEEALAIAYSGLLVAKMASDTIGTQYYNPNWGPDIPIAEKVNPAVVLIKSAIPQVVRARNTVDYLYIESRSTKDSINAAITAMNTINSLSDSITKALVNFNYVLTKVTKFFTTDIPMNLYENTNTKFTIQDWVLLEIANIISVPDISTVTTSGISNGGKGGKGPRVAYSRTETVINKLNPTTDATIIASLLQTKILSSIPPMVTIDTTLDRGDYKKQRARWIKIVTDGIAAGTNVYIPPALNSETLGFLPKIKERMSTVFPYLTTAKTSTDPEDALEAARSMVNIASDIQDLVEKAITSAIKVLFIGKMYCAIDNESYLLYKVDSWRSISNYHRIKSELNAAQPTFIGAFNSILKASATNIEAKATLNAVKASIFPAAPTTSLGPTTPIISLDTAVEAAITQLSQTIPTTLIASLPTGDVAAIGNAQAALVASSTLKGTASTAASTAHTTAGQSQSIAEISAEKVGLGLVKIAAKEPISVNTVVVIDAVAEDIQTHAINNFKNIIALADYIIDTRISSNQIIKIRELITELRRMPVETFKKSIYIDPKTVGYGAASGYQERSTSYSMPSTQIPLIKESMRKINVDSDIIDNIHNTYLVGLTVTNTKNAITSASNVINANNYNISGIEVAINNILKNLDKFIKELKPDVTAPRKITATRLLSEATILLTQIYPAAFAEIDKSSTYFDRTITPIKTVTYGKFTYDVNRLKYYIDLITEKIDNILEAPTNAILVAANEILKVQAKKAIEYGKQAADAIAQRTHNGNTPPPEEIGQSLAIIKLTQDATKRSIEVINNIIAVVNNVNRALRKSETYGHSWMLGAKSLTNSITKLNEPPLSDLQKTAQNAANAINSIYNTVFLGTTLSYATNLISTAVNHSSNAITALSTASTNAKNILDLVINSDTNADRSKWTTLKIDNEVHEILTEAKKTFDKLQSSVIDAESAKKMAVDAFTAFKSGNPATMTPSDSPADAEMRQKAVNFLARIQIIADEATKAIIEFTSYSEGGSIQYDSVTKVAFIKESLINHPSYQTERDMITIYNASPQLNSTIDSAVKDAKLILITVAEAQNNAIKAATNTQTLLNNASKQKQHAEDLIVSYAWPRSMRMEYMSSVPRRPYTQSMFYCINGNDAGSGGCKYSGKWNNIQNLAGKVTTLQNEIQTIITNLQNLRGTIPVPIF
jgi:hypothetical protein